MSRKRGILSPHTQVEMVPKLRHSTKKELAEKEKSTNLACPVPLKVRKNLRLRYSNSKDRKLRPFCFNNNVTLSSKYDPNQKLSYFNQIFSKMGCIGEGSFGKVYMVKNKEDNQLYAVKRLKSHISLNDRSAEVKNNELLGINLYCVRFFMAWEENLDTFILLEYCDLSVADYSKLNSSICEDFLWHVLHDICKALDYIHSMRFVHLDVKPGNIMMKSGIFKLGDFGLLVDLQMANQAHKSTLSEGDAKYLALEVLDGVYTSACDIFGLGITILELATDIELPDHGILWRQIRQGLLPSCFYDRVTEVLCVTVEDMVSSDYKTRPAAEKILKYPQIQNISDRDAAQHPRIDYAAPYARKENNNENLSLASSNLESDSSNISTPPRSANSSFYTMNSDSSFNDSDDESNCEKCKVSSFRRGSPYSPLRSLEKSSPLPFKGDSLISCNSRVADALLYNALPSIMTLKENNAESSSIKRIPKLKLVFTE
ncbi:hypothetical protein ABEB36_011491 [Hypothenemus hampei]|uniref:non-specific serine/threonine protein kinase n=1 Tax=Hypothenemus hampei TaxID=57062 RepID=A0ABD1EFZ1_HYPHA